MAAEDDDINNPTIDKEDPVYETTEIIPRKRPAMEDVTDAMVGTSQMAITMEEIGLEMRVETSAGSGGDRTRVKV